MDAELHAQALEEGGLAGGGGAGDQGDFDPVPMGHDAIGDLRDALFVKAFGHPHHFVDFPLQHQPVQGAYVFDAEGAVPGLGLAMDGEELGRAPGRLVQVAVVFACRKAKHQSPDQGAILIHGLDFFIGRIHGQAEMRHVARRRRYRAVMDVHGFAQANQANGLVPEGV